MTSHPITAVSRDLVLFLHERIDRATAMHLEYIDGFRTSDADGAYQAFQSGVAAGTRAMLESAIEEALGVLLVYGSGECKLDEARAADARAGKVIRLLRAPNPAEERRERVAWLLQRIGAAKPEHRRSLIALDKVVLADVAMAQFKGDPISDELLEGLEIIHVKVQPNYERLHTDAGRDTERTRIAEEAARLLKVQHPSWELLEGEDLAWIHERSDSSDALTSDQRTHLFVLHGRALRLAHEADMVRKAKALLEDVDRFDRTFEDMKPEELAWLRSHAYTTPTLAEAHEILDKMGGHELLAEQAA